MSFLTVVALFFISEKFYRNKSLDFGKTFKNKLRIKPGLLSCRT